MRQDLDKILEMLKDKTINAKEAESLIKAIHRVQICEDIKRKTQCVLDASANMVLKTVDLTVMGVEKINPLLKAASSEISKTVRKIRNKKRHKIDIELDF